MKYSLKRLFIVVTCIAAFLWLILGLYHALTDVEFGENEPSVSWLPKSATNVSFYKSYAWTAYEFDIPEDDFVNWSWSDLAPIRGSVSIPRYCAIKTKVPDIGANPTDEQIKALGEAIDAQTAVVSNGLSFTHRQRNGGGVIVAYDRDRGKAFVWTAPR